MSSVETVLFIINLLAVGILAGFGIKALNEGSRGLAVFQFCVMAINLPFTFYWLSKLAQ